MLPTPSSPAASSSRSSSTSSHRPRLFIPPTTTYPLPPPPIAPSFAQPRPTSCPIIIDNGSSQLRAGWGDDSNPRFIRDQLVSKYKDRKLNKTVLLYGREAEMDASSKGHSKTVWDGDVLTGAEAMEHALDYTFMNLGITSSSVEHPILVSERLATPLHSRALMSELLFEAYNAKSVAYGVDSLFSFSRTGKQDGLVIGMGNSSTSIIPVVGGRGLMTSARRLAWGGTQANELMLKLVQLKYPSFPTKVTAPQATFMRREACYFAEDYHSEITSFADPTRMAANDVLVQFPFVIPVSDEKSEEELAKMAEKRKEGGRRLAEMQQKQRLEKLIKQETDMASFREIKDAKLTDKKVAYQARLENAGFESEADLDAAIKKIEESMKRARKKDLGEDAPPEEEPSFPLLLIPDAELNEEEIKEKKKQKLFKAGYDARMRLKAEKLAEKARMDELEKKEEEERVNDPQGWCAKQREDHEATIHRISERKRRKAALRDRKSAAAQSRMKSIANLAADGPAPKKRRKGGDDDGFGKTDDDWAIYREIGNGNESEEEEDDQTLLKTLETRLLNHDPTFSLTQTFLARSQQQNSLLTAFLRGDDGSASEPRFDPESLEQSYQLHLNVERSRVPEVWFQPSIAGLDSAGVGEIVEHVLRERTKEEMKRMQQGFFVTGGSASLPGIVARLTATLRPVLPFQSSFNVSSPSEPRLDAWRGMAEWSRTQEFGKALITKKEYEEFGAEYVKEHRWGNYRTG